jgi:hypothetical protein
VLAESHFNEERVNGAFRKVRNRLRKHLPFEIISACIKKLNEQPVNRIQHLTMYQPWRLLLLIKWTFIYGEYLSPDRKNLTVNDFNYLLNLMHDFEGRLRHPHEYDNIFLFFRNMAFQQFWLQREFNMPYFARQNLLFGRLRNGHPFKRMFIDKCGISIPEFIELAMMLMTRFTVEKQTSVTSNWFRTVADKYKPGAIQNFLDLLSIEFGSLREKLLKEKQANRKISYEAYEQTPLRGNPLLKHDSKYYPFSVELLGRCLETFIYDTLRSDDPNDFMDKFGIIFEKYVGNSISNTKNKYFTERQLTDILPGEGKVVDYLLIDKNNKIFIDAKGVEMSYLGMVGHEPEVITDKTRNSIVKGIQQGFETARRLGNIERIGETETGSGNNYLIVVTFKDMYVGNGVDFYEYVAKDTLNKIIGQSGNMTLIPFEHMYFMSIDDFDLLTGGIASGEINLTEILDHAVKCDALQQTKKFTFEQHIYDKYPNMKAPLWLIDESKYILDCCRLRFDTKI